MSSQPLVSRLTQSWINSETNTRIDSMSCNWRALIIAVSRVTAEDMMNVFEVNSVAPLMLTKALLPLLKVSAAKRKTSIINMSSGLGSISRDIPPNPLFKIYPYRTSKAALNMITKCLSVDLKPYNISVISINPGHLKTDMGGPAAQLDVSTDDVLGKCIRWDGSITPW
ncbi:unnamed protein product [Oppiella nova]|uniref:Uncharacterized protein n=1 Tax=Oppiella nova TaxID=334625 RepID=A0A7R9MKM2_9ACAR|nr:unnamed protein product [Oppiella nova]CAG2179131.1 unnamed protein product [Oppiella nova]